MEICPLSSLFVYLTGQVALSQWSPRGLLLDQLWLWVPVYSNKTLERVTVWHSPTFNQRLRGDLIRESFILGNDNPQGKFSLQDREKEERERLSSELGSTSHAVRCLRTYKLSFTRLFLGYKFESQVIERVVLSCAVLAILKPYTGYRVSHT